MDKNDILLWLTGKYFSKLLGFDSYEEFIDRSFFFKVNLSTNTLLDYHLGSYNKVSPQIFDIKDLKYRFTEYESSMLTSVKSFVAREDRDGVLTYYNRQHLLDEFCKGNSFDTMGYHFLIGENLRWVESCYELVQDESGDIIGYFLTIDMDEFKRKTDDMMQKAERDKLTGLYNRNVIEAMTTYYVSKPEEKSAVFTFDIDSFKQLNDRYGHSFGDKVIVAVAKKLQEFFPETNSLICRQGGDEFVVLCKDISEPEAEKLAAAFTEKQLELPLNEKTVTISVSVGFSVYPKHGNEYKKLFKRADMALYYVKMNEKGHWKKFNNNLYNVKRDSLGFNVSEISSGIPGGFLIYRADSGEILFANQDLISMVGCKNLDEFMEFTDGSFNTFVYEEDLEGVLYKIRDQLDTYKDGHDYVKYRIRTKSGKIKMVEDYGNLVHSKDNGDLFYVLIIDLEHRNKLKAR